MINFEAIKHGVKITDVCARYGIQLRFRGEWASAKCPLPMHKEGDKDKTFQVNIAGNFWKCWSETCNAKNGGKRGGDVINFVAVMEGCRERDAAQKLADWYGVQSAKFVSPRPEDVHKQKAPQRMAEGSKEKPKTQMQSSIQNGSTLGDSVKYMASIDLWYDEASIRLPDESDEDYRKRFLKGLKAKLIESYRAGKLARSAA